jgi:ubiquinone/menaquinone biosynthesis C-methylase UbiE
MPEVREDFSTRSRLRDLGRWYVTRFVEKVAASLPPGTKLLDAGAGEGVYRKCFAHCEYRAIDLAVGEPKWNYGHLNYVGPLHDMPIESELFDAVICTQVLEHLEWPRESVKEMFRVLKPGGRLFMTVPMAHGEHQIPYDFFRYTSFGLRSICQHAGFSQIDIKPFGGFCVRWAYELPLLVTLLPSLRKSDGRLAFYGVVSLPFKVLLRALLMPLQILLILLDGFDGKKDYPFGWGVTACK